MSGERKKEEDASPSHILTSLFCVWMLPANHKNIRFSWETISTSFSALLGSTVDTCTYVSPGGRWTVPVFFYVNVDLGSEVDSASCCSLGNLDTLRAPRPWQLVVRCLGRLIVQDCWETTLGNIVYSASHSGCTHLRPSTRPTLYFTRFLRGGTVPDHGAILADGPQHSKV